MQRSLHLVYHFIRTAYILLVFQLSVGNIFYNRFNRLLKVHNRAYVVLNATICKVKVMGVYQSAKGTLVVSHHILQLLPGLASLNCPKSREGMFGLWCLNDKDNLKLIH